MTEPFNKAYRERVQNAIMVAVEAASYDPATGTIIMESQEIGIALMDCCAFLLAADPKREQADKNIEAAVDFLREGVKIFRERHDKGEINFADYFSLPN